MLRPFSGEVTKIIEVSWDEIPSVAEWMSNMEPSGSHPGRGAYGGMISHESARGRCRGVLWARLLAWGKKIAMLGRGAARTLDERDAGWTGSAPPWSPSVPPCSAPLDGRKILRAPRTRGRTAALHQMPTQTPTGYSVGVRSFKPLSTTRPLVPCASITAPATVQQNRPRTRLKAEEAWRRSKC